MMKLPSIFVLVATFILGLSNAYSDHNDDRWDRDYEGDYREYDRDEYHHDDEWDRGRFGGHRAVCRVALVDRRGRIHDRFSARSGDYSYREARRKACMRALRKCHHSLYGAGPGSRGRGGIVSDIIGTIVDVARTRNLSCKVMR